ncbi:hypothetical protein ElyMa_004250400 [Elysia marginata]|uniref:Biogenesis of lysosome-related organelles complex 1 subunit 5 n=1 Tax=Elysia marginata TaxID=1093978 RepID=A0AAV4GSN7_9GAST|nr:hypothetical protein ElyMa_004250400 [Elysia marginata]
MIKSLVAAYLLIECKMSHKAENFVIQDYTFEEFQKRLGDLREVAKTILEKIANSDNLPSTKEENYTSCVQNLTDRINLLNEFASHLDKQRKELREKSKDTDDDEKKIEVMEAKSKLKTVEDFLDIIEAERKREDFYRKKATEKYMENYLEITKGKGSDSS